jgi:hypothetical protein
MHAAINRFHRGAPRVLGASAFVSVLVLVVWDFVPRLFPDRAHDLLGALPLALVACAYLADQFAQRASPGEFAKAALLAIAFLFWAANQFWPDFALATLFNDIAIALFVVDVLLTMMHWPSGPPLSHVESQEREV